MYKCPDCKDADRIDVEIRTNARLVQPKHDRDAFETDVDEADNGHDHEWGNDSNATCAACGYTGIMEEFEVDEDDEEDEDEDEGPGEGDLTTTNETDFYQDGKKVLTIDIDATSEERNEAIREYCRKEQYFPNAWVISDHGNACLIEL